KVLAHVGAVGNLAEPTARSRFGGRLQVAYRGRERRLAVLRGERNKTRRSDARRRELRLQIAELQGALPHVRRDEIEHVAVRLAAMKQADDRKREPFAVYIARVGLH